MSKREAQLKHLVTTVIECTETDQPFIWTQLMGITSPPKLMTVATDPEELERSLYVQPPPVGDKETKPTEFILTPTNQKTISLLGKFIHHQWIDGKTDFSSCTSQDFYDFCASDIDPNGTPAPAPQPVAPTTPRPPSITYSKRDVSAYKEISQRFNFYSWIIQSKGTAISQGVSTPFDPNYVPASLQERQQFEIDNAFVYTVAAACIKYPSGREIVNRHAQDLDGQAVLQALQDEAESPIIRKTSKDILEKKLKNMSADPEKWTKPLENFLTTWSTLKLQLEGVMGTNLDPDKALEWLKDSLIVNPTARSAMDTAELIQTTIQRNLGAAYQPWTFDQWYEHFKFSFQQTDEGNRRTNASNRESRTPKKTSDDRQSKDDKDNSGDGKPGKVPDEYARTLDSGFQRRNGNRGHQNNENSIWRRLVQRFEPIKALLHPLATPKTIPRRSPARRQPHTPQQPLPHHLP